MSSELHKTLDIFECICESEIFKGGEISLPKFKKFVQKNPEYEGVYNDWKKLFDKSMELFLKDMNAYRNSTPYDKIKKLHDYLVELRKGI